MIYIPNPQQEMKNQNHPTLEIPGDSITQGTASLDI